MRIRPVDVGSDDDLARYHQVYAAATRHGRPYATPVPLAELTALYRAPSTTVDRSLLVADAGGSIVGVARIELPLTDNLHLAEVARRRAP